MLLTKIIYLYRDAGNSKFWGEFVVSGHFEICNVEAFLLDGEFFVPHEVGLSHLLDMPMNQDDHYLHTLETTEAVDDGDPICSALELEERFKSAHLKGWFSSF